MEDLFRAYFFEKFDSFLCFVKKRFTNFRILCKLNLTKGQRRANKYINPQQTFQSFLFLFISIFRVITRVDFSTAPTCEGFFGPTTRKPAGSCSEGEAQFTTKTDIEKKIIFLKKYRKVTSLTLDERNRQKKRKEEDARR